MNNKKKALLAGLLIVVVALALFWLGRSGDERIINRRLDDLISLVNKDGPESQIEALGKARRISTFFVEQPLVRALPNQGVAHDRDRVAGILVVARNQASSIQVAMRNRQIHLSEDGLRARIYFTGSANVVYSGGSDRHRADYTMEMIKRDGEWLIVSVDIDR